MKNDQYYYSESEWNRLGCGPLPPERNIELKSIENNNYLVYPVQQPDEDRPLNPYSIT